MISKLIALFRDPLANVPVTEEDEREALAAILVEAGHADGDYSAAEKARIARILSARFNLSPGEAVTLRASGEEARDAATDLVRFTQAINRIVPHEERIGMIEAVWEVAYADGVRDEAESSFVRRLCGLMYVADRDAGVARQRVAKRLGHS